MIRPAGPPPFAQVIPLHDAGTDKPPVVETQPIFARHRGRCHGCRGPIRIDEMIQRVDGSWHHEECVPGDAVEGWRAAA